MTWSSAPGAIYQVQFSDSLAENNVLLDLYEVASYVHNSPFWKAQINEVFVNAQEGLFEFVKEASGEDAQSDCFDSIQTLHRIKPAVCEEFDAEDEFARRIPQVLRHVAGYNLHRLGRENPNPAEVLVGSEGSLAFSTRIELNLAPLPRNKVLGVCHFPTFRYSDHISCIVRGRLVPMFRPLPP